MKRPSIILWVLFLAVMNHLIWLNACGAEEVKEKNEPNQAGDSPAEVIREIEQLSKLLPSRLGPEADQEQWDRWKTQVNEVLKSRLQAIAQLKKTGLPEEELKPYIIMEIDDMESCYFYSGREAGRIQGELDILGEDGLLLEKRLATEMYWKLNVWYINTHLMHLSDADLQTIADFEISRKELPEAGRLMADALKLGHLNENQKLLWSTWMLEKMNPESEGYQWVEGKNRLKANFGEIFSFNGTDLNGKEIRSDAYKGKVVLLDFWALYCGFCLQEMPELKEMQEKYFDQGFRIIGVFNDNRFEELQEYVQKHGYDWPQLIEPAADNSSFKHSLTRSCGISSFPRYLLIGRDGKLRKEGGSVELIKPEIMKLLEEE